MVDRNSSRSSGNGQGAVKDPENDGRLKDNRDSGSSRSASGRSRDDDGQFQSSDDRGGGNSGGRSRSASSRSDDYDRERGSGSDWEPGQTGAVKDPEHDGRLKENREAGVTMGTTEHSAQAPHVKGNDDYDDRDSRR